MTDMQGNTVSRTKIWFHARKIALDDILATGCKRDELGTYCAKNGPLNGLWYKATMETFQKLIERSRHILSQAIQRVPVSNVDEGQLVAIKKWPHQKKTTTTTKHIDDDGNGNDDYDDTH